MELIATSSASGWWLLSRRDDEGPWRRTPLAAWAMVADGGAPFLVGMVVANDGETVELAPPGRYFHADQQARCGCSVPVPDVPFDAGFCTTCAGLIPGTT